VDDVNATAHAKIATKTTKTAATTAAVFGVIAKAISKVRARR
jgi:hypothetical protein